MKLHAACAFLSVTLVAAGPRPQDDEEAGTVFGISFTFENGTFTDVYDVPETLSGYPIGSNDIVTNVFIYPPPRQSARCAFLEPEPSRQGLGVWTIARATAVVLDSPAEVGYVQCNRA